MRFLVSPCAYKGSFSALQVAYAISVGIRTSLPSAQISMAPIADGGDGTLDAVYAGVGGVFHSIEVHDAIGRPVVAKWLALDDVAVVELATSSGLAPLIVEKKMNAMTANTYGLGEVIRAALASKPKQLFICVGGSASTDGGAGLLMALGAKFSDSHGNPIKLGGQGLIDTDSCDLTELKVLIEQSGVETIKVAVDVTNPLLGDNGAAAVYGPQKGADTASVIALDKGLEQFAKVLETYVGRNCKDLPGSGAAGGTAFGVSAAIGAEMISGFSWVSSVVNLEKKIQECDLVVTAEGYLDHQSIQGKAIGELAKLCAKYHKQLWAVPACTDSELDWNSLGVHKISTSSAPGKWADEAAIQIAASALCQGLTSEISCKMRALADQLAAAGFTRNTPLVPCSDEDIFELENRFGVRLPCSYKSFLKVMGRGGGDFLNDGHWSYPQEMMLEGVNSLLVENKSSFKLSSTDFAFLCRDNFFFYFDTTAGDDPPVFIFKDGGTSPSKFFDSFSEWLTVCIHGEIAIVNEALRLEQERLARTQENCS